MVDLVDMALNLEVFEVQQQCAAETRLVDYGYGPKRNLRPSRRLYSFLYPIAHSPGTRKGPLERCRLHSGGGAMLNANKTDAQFSLVLLHVLCLKCTDRM